MNSERLDEQELRSKSTAELVRHALEEAKLLAKAEVIHAKQELKSELRSLKGSAILIGIGGALALCALAAFFVALGLLIPVSPPAGVALAGAGVLVAAVVLGFIGFKKLPKKPLPRTQERLRQDFAVTRERLA